VHEYTMIVPEGDRHMPEADGKLPAGWPLQGEVVFKGAKLRYRPGLPLVLKGLDIRIWKWSYFPSSVLSL